MVASLKFPSGLTVATMDSMERYLFVGSLDGRIFCVDLSMPTSNASAMDILAQENSFFPDGMEHSKSNKEYDVLYGHTGHITSLSTSIDGNLLLSSSFDGTARIWDLQSRQVVRTILTNKGAITHSAIILNPLNTKALLAGESRENASEKLPQTIQPFKQFLHRNERSAYSNTSDSSLLLSMSVPVVLQNTTAFSSDLRETETESQKVLADIQSCVAALCVRR